jgi:hypothetical protein
MHPTAPIASLSQKLSALSAPSLPILLHQHTAKGRKQVKEAASLV